MHPSIIRSVAVVKTDTTVDHFSQIYSSYINSWNSQAPRISWLLTFVVVGPPFPPLLWNEIINSETSTSHIKVKQFGRRDENGWVYESTVIILWPCEQKGQNVPKLYLTIPNVFPIPLPANDVISLLIGQSECDTIVDKLDHFLMIQSEEKWRHFQRIGGFVFGDTFI